MSLSRPLSRSLSRSLSRGLTGDLDPDFLAYRTLASSLVSEPFDLTATDGYDSDFSAGVDGWTNSANASLTGNVDGISGFDNNLQVETTTGGNFIAGYNGLVTVGQTYTFGVMYLIPSTNTGTVLSVQLLDGGVTVFTDSSPAEDVWITISPEEYTATSGNPSLKTNLSGGAIGDKIYFRTVVIRNTAYASFTTSETEAIQNARFVGYKGSVPSRWSNAAVYGTAPTPVDVWNNNLTEVYGLSMVKFAGALAKLKYDSVSTLTNNNFVAGDYDPLSGLTGDGSSKYLGTGYDPSGLSGADLAFGVYVTAGASSNDRAIGSGDASFANLTAIDMATGNLRAYISSVGLPVSQPAGAANGIIIGSSTSTTSLKLFKDGTNVATQSGTRTTTITAQAPYLFAVNENGSASNISALTETFGFYGSGMSDAAAEWLTWVESCVAVDGGYNTFDPTVRWP